MGELSGRVAVVTGGAGGIGRATAELFVAEGARVVLADVAREQGEAVAAELGDDLAAFERVTAVNLLGVMVGTQRAARRMVEGGGGSIIDTTSMSAFTPGGGVMTYRASKAGVIAFSQSVSIELGRHGVRVNCLSPGLIPTGMTRANFDVETITARLQPLARMGTPEDAANAALYLASDRSARVTGIVLPIDGGASVGTPPRKRPQERAASRRRASASNGRTTWKIE